MKMFLCFVAGLGVAFAGLWVWDSYWRERFDPGAFLQAEEWVFETSISVGEIRMPVYRNTLTGERAMWAPGTPAARWVRMGVPGS